MLPAPTNPFRLVCWKLVTYGGYFDAIILISICVNCFFMAIEDPNANDDNEKGHILYFTGGEGNLPYISYSSSMLIGRVLLWIFTVESLLKCAAYMPWGYFFGPDANWNRLDFFIVMVGWLEEDPAQGKLRLAHTWNSDESDEQVPEEP